MRVRPAQLSSSNAAEDRAGCRFWALPWISYLFYRRRFEFHEVTRGHSPLGTRPSLARPATILLFGQLSCFGPKKRELVGPILDILLNAHPDECPPATL